MHVSQELVTLVNRCRIPQHKLVVGKKLGKGFFGNVHKGQLTMNNGNLKTVAVKSLRGDFVLLESFKPVQGFEFRSLLILL